MSFRFWRDRSSSGRLPRARWAVVLLVSLVVLTVRSEEPEPIPSKRLDGLPVNARTDRLVAWCIVPFDAAQRTPEQRAAMLAELGLRRCAYDWREEHVPTFEREILAYRDQGIEFFAFWGEHPDAFALFEKYDLHPQIWQTAPSPAGATDAERIAAAVQTLGPLARRTASLGCPLGLYNHGGWGGEPEHLIAVCQALREQGHDHVGIVYNFHHGHDQISPWREVFPRLKPYLLCLNLNGMATGAQPKIETLGEGAHEAEMLRVVFDSDYQGPLGVIDHRDDTDSRVTLAANLRGLARIVASWLGQRRGSISVTEIDPARAILQRHAIPHGPLPESHETHAATITEASDGTLVAAWFGGTKEGHPDVKIWSSRKPPGQAWTEPTVVDDGLRSIDGREVEFSCWNPVLITHGDGTIYCYYKITGLTSKFGPRNWWGAVRTSSDGGQSWSERIWLPTLAVPEATPETRAVFEPYAGHLAGPVKNRPIVLPDGRLLCGSSTETDRFGWRVHFEVYEADDWTGAKHGATVIGPILTGKVGIQPSFLVHDQDRQRLQVLTREDGQAFSDDGGQTWTPITPGPIDTSVGLHAVTTASGWHILAFNPSGRTPLSLARSRDGQTWETVLPIVSADGSAPMDYPTIFQARDGRLHLVHSWGRQRIEHLVLDADVIAPPVD